jgi:hypothetical protein
LTASTSWHLDAVGWEPSTPSAFDRDGYRRLAPVYARHAELGGLAADAAAVAARVGDMPVVAEAAMMDLFGQAGFRPVAPFFRGLWYAGWWIEAA